MLAAFLQQIGQVEVIAVKMDQVGILRCEGEELVKQCRFVFRAVGEPLPDTFFFLFLLVNRDLIYF